jgi:hypothetical protein
MQYDHFKQKLKSELPINRKERFYTGTVLPSILFHDGLSNLFCFLREIEGFPKSVNEKNTQDNLLFYTEYNLKESAGKKSVGAEICTATGDTPDVIIEILEPQKVFIVIEAKMFSKLTRNDLGKQMAAQKNAIIDILRDKYGLDNAQIFHLALTPRQLGFKTTGDYQIINWEFLLDNKDINLQDNYFANYLKFAIEHYDDLVCDQAGMASTVEGQVPGSKVYVNGIGEKTLWVGRKGGKHIIEEDVKKGIWSDKLYAINTQKPQGGQKGNWISSHEFAAIVDGATKGFTLIPGRWYACELSGDEFEDDMCSYSPIKIRRIEPLKHGNRTLRLDFYHANYPEGVREKSYTLQTIERGERFLLARSVEHNPVRILQIYEINHEWIIRHFPKLVPDRKNIQTWLDRNL